jgi:4-aminobutyrate aminotransferase-like enzyme
MADLVDEKRPDVPVDDLSPEPRSIAWANSFADGAPRVSGPIPGPESQALERRRSHHELGAFAWLERMPVGYASGAGVTLDDVDGNRFIDLTHGHMSSSLGHGNPEIVGAVERQMRKLMHVRSYPTGPRIELMERLAEVTPEDLDLFAFFSSATEATEAALRVARAVTGGNEFLSFYGDFHGHTTGAFATAGRGSNPSTGPRPGGFMSVPGGWCHRCDFQLEPSTCGLHCVAFAERAMKSNSHGGLAGIITEPITNGSGARVYAPGFLRGLREIADRNRMLLIFDEHATGLGRTGAWWAGDHEGVVPDIIIFGKYLGNGYPITMVAVREKFRDAARGVTVTSTHGGQPAACAAALAVLDIIQRDALVDHVRTSGEACLAFLKQMEGRYSILGIAQGKGYQLGMEFIDPRTGLPSGDIAFQVGAACMERGVCVSPSGAAVRVSPMIVTSESVALRALALVEDAVADVDSRLS